MSALKAAVRPAAKTLATPTVLWFNYNNSGTFTALPADGYSEADEDYAVLSAATADGGRTWALTAEGWYGPSFKFVLTLTAPLADALAIFAAAANAQITLENGDIKAEPAPALPAPAYPVSRASWAPKPPRA